MFNFRVHGPDYEYHTGEKIARNWVLGCFLLAMDAIL